MDLITQSSPFFRLNGAATPKGTLQGLGFSPLTATPTGLTATDEGRLWWRSDLDEYNYWDGTTVQSFSSQNFANADLTATGSRTHTFNANNLDLDFTTGNFDLTRADGTTTSRLLMQSSGTNTTYASAAVGTNAVQVGSQVYLYSGLFGPSGFSGVQLTTDRIDLQFGTADLRINGVSGTDGQIVRSTGSASSPEWFTPDYGHTNVGPTLGDYATVQLAVAAGRYKIRVIEDTIETIPFSVPDTNTGLDIIINPEINWTLDDIEITCDHPVSIVTRSDGTGTVNIQRDTTTDPFVSYNADGIIGGVFELRNINLNETGAQAGVSGITNCPRQKWIGVNADLRNEVTPRISGGTSEFLMDNCNFTGGGANCRVIDQTLSTQLISNTTFGATSSGVATYTLGGTLRDIVINGSTLASSQLFLEEATVDGLDMSGQDSMVVEIRDCPTINRMVAANSATAGYIQMSNVPTIPTLFTNCELPTLRNVGFVSNYLDNFKFIGCTFYSTFGAFALGESDSVSFSDCTFFVALTMSSLGSGHLLNNVIYNPDGGASLSLQSDNTIITGGRFGSATGGTGVTIVIAATAANTFINGALVDVDIVDSGTNTTALTATY